MYNKRFENLIGCAYPAGFSVLTCGYAVCESDFSGTVTNPPYSRLYFILGGALIVKPKDGRGDALRLEPGLLYLLPRGYSFDYCSEGSLSHLYFHMTMTNGGVDILSSIPEPLSVHIGIERIEELLSACSAGGGISQLSAARRLLHSVELVFSEGRIREPELSVLPEAREAARIIDGQPRMGITLADLARELHISERTLTRKFRLSFGMSVGEYVLSRVMGLAEWDLLYSKLTLCEISEKYGFCDRFYFSRRFKEYFGVSPITYKERSVL